MDDVECFGADIPIDSNGEPFGVDVDVDVLAGADAVDSQAHKDREPLARPTSL